MTAPKINVTRDNGVKEKWFMITRSSCKHVGQFIRYTWHGWHIDSVKTSESCLFFLTVSAKCVHIHMYALILLPGHQILRVSPCCTRRLLLIGSLPNSSRLPRQLHSYWVDLVSPKHFHRVFIRVNPFHHSFCPSALVLIWLSSCFCQEKLSQKLIVNNINTIYNQGKHLSVHTHKTDELQQQKTTPGVTPVS